ncbi:helix-turn-helix domain-containing protein [Intrasporangium sp.]|uniref:helix-turn-helix domain-containing protein n=1 Tax=Intrasporangium sp. TaxID=1925024 RepID=UPI0029395FB8|nr:helix-turn-helix domain-containing protein [Intrasporangium sp.]MDV3221176.1 LuxR C-terminal-related transcriptional regulator [Intrasporangium sp.]
MLESIGVATEDEELYRLLLREPDLAPDELAARLGRTRPALDGALHRLEVVGLVTRSSRKPARWRPSRPDVAIDVLVSRRRAELDRVAEASREWLAEMAVPDRYQPERLVEIIVGQDAIAARFAQLMQATEAELLVLDRPPYATQPDEADRSVRGLLSSGVRVRGIYSPDSLQLPGAVDEAHSAVDAGERSRIHPDVPMKLAIGDRRQALLPLAADRVIDSALVVHSSALLDALVRMFELLWDQALPIARHHGDDLDARLITMLTAGMGDDAIARRLGVSTRTVGRRVAQLMDRLGASTRFQAGAHAERRVAAEPHGEGARGREPGEASSPAGGHEGH